MSDVFCYLRARWSGLSYFFHLAHRLPRVNDRCILSGIVYVILNSRQWKDAPEAYAMITMDQAQESAASRSYASGAFALPLALLPEPLIKALKSYQDSNTKKLETETGEG